MCMQGLLTVSFYSNNCDSRLLIDTYFIIVLFLFYLLMSVIINLDFCKIIQCLLLARRPRSYMRICEESYLFQ
jgi:hypothetical protein